MVILPSVIYIIEMIKEGENMDTFAEWLNRNDEGLARTLGTLGLGLATGLSGCIGDKCPSKASPASTAVKSDVPEFQGIIHSGSNDISQTLRAMDMDFEHRFAYEGHLEKAVKGLGPKERRAVLRACALQFEKKGIRGLNDFLDGLEGPMRQDYIDLAVKY